MRAIAIASVLWFSLAAGLWGEEAKKELAEPKAQHTVQCRFIDPSGAVMIAPKVTLDDGLKGLASDQTQTPFVVALTKEHGTVQPLIEIVKTGMSVEFTVCEQPDHRAILDATVEASEIGQVCVKKEITTVTIDSAKKRVIDRVSLGEKLAVALAQPGHAGETWHVELLVDAANK